MVEQRTENPRVTSSSLVPGKLKHFTTNTITAMQTNFVYKVYQIYRQNYVHKDKLIGISSGNDSIVLVFIMSHIQFLLNQQINLLHCNHFYQKYNFYYIHEIFKISYLLRGTLIISSPIQQSFDETNNRNWRQRLFKRALLLKEIEYIFLAHTKTDKNETFFFNLMRGTSLTGCSNFTTQKIKLDLSCFSTSLNSNKLNLKTRQVFNFNRPLLAFSRNQLKKLIQINSLPYSLDPTNLNISFSRNRIRLILFPILKNYFNFNIETQLEKFLVQAETDSQFFESNANKLAQSIQSRKTLTKLEFKKLPKAFQLKILKLLIKKYSGRDVSFNLIRRLLNII